MAEDKQIGIAQQAHVKLPNAMIEPGTSTFNDKQTKDERKGKKKRFRFLKWFKSRKNKSSYQSAGVNQGIVIRSNVGDVAPSTEDVPQAKRVSEEVIEVSVKEADTERKEEDIEKQSVEPVTEYAEPEIESVDIDPPSNLVQQDLRRDEIKSPAPPKDRQASAKSKWKRRNPLKDKNPSQTSVRSGPEKNAEVLRKGRDETESRKKTTRGHDGRTPKEEPVPSSRRRRRQEEHKRMQATNMARPDQEVTEVIAMPRVPILFNKRKSKGLPGQVIDSGHVENAEIESASPKANHPKRRRSRFGKKSEAKTENDVSWDAFDAETVAGNRRPNNDLSNVRREERTVVKRLNNDVKHGRETERRLTQAVEQRVYNKDVKKGLGTIPRRKDKPGPPQSDSPKRESSASPDRERNTRKPSPPPHAKQDYNEFAFEYSDNSSQDDVSQN